MGIWVLAHAFIVYVGVVVFLALADTEWEVVEIDEFVISTILGKTNIPKHEQKYEAYQHTQIERHLLEEFRVKVTIFRKEDSLKRVGILVEDSFGPVEKSVNEGFILAFWRQVNVWVFHLFKLFILSGDVE